MEDCLDLTGFWVVKYVSVISILIMKFCGIGFAKLYFDSEVLWNRLCRTMLYFVSLLFVLLFGLLGFCTTHTIPIGGKTICISNQIQYFNKSYNIGAAASRVVQLIGKCPQILHCIVEDNLDPKLQLLVKNSIMRHHPWKLFTSNPVILDADLDSQIEPRVEFLQY